MSTTPRELQSWRPKKPCIRADLMNLLAVGSNLIAIAQPVQTSLRPWETKVDLWLTSTLHLKPRPQSLQRKSLQLRRAKQDREHQNKIIRLSLVFQELKLKKDLVIAGRCASQNIWISPYSTLSTHLRKSREGHVCQSNFKAKRQLKNYKGLKTLLSLRIHRQIWSLQIPWKTPSNILQQ